MRLSLIYIICILRHFLNNYFHIHLDMECNVCGRNLREVTIIIAMYVDMTKRNITAVAKHSSGKTTINAMKRTALDNSSKQREAGE